MSARLLVAAASAIAIIAACGAASTAGFAVETPAGIDFVECQVYPVEKPTTAFDCAGNIRKSCGAANPCEVVIGLQLTDGRQIDGDAKAWKKVRVRYRCGSEVKTVGPYVQSEHATIRLVCQSRPL